jgi:hypothetical protein
MKTLDKIQKSKTCILKHKYWVTSGDPSAGFYFVICVAGHFRLKFKRNTFCQVYTVIYVLVSCK